MCPATHDSTLEKIVRALYVNILNDKQNISHILKSKDNRKT